MVNFWNKKFTLLGALLLAIGAFGFSWQQVYAAPTTLQPNDIVLLTVNSDGNYSAQNCLVATDPNNNAFDLLLRKDIGSGTEIKVTDNAWNGTALLTNEGRVTYTAATDLSAGTIIRYADCLLQDPSSGWARSGNFDPAAAGDNYLIYQGTEASPQFIYGFGYGSNPWIISGAPNTNNSYLPSVLAAVLPFPAYNTMTANARNFQYDDVGISGIFADDFIDYLHMPSRWVGTGALNPGGSAGVTYGQFALSLDVTRPLFNDAVRYSPSDETLYSTDTVRFRITTTEPVEDLGPDDFDVYSTGPITYSSVQTIKVNSTTYDIEVSGIGDQGTVSVGSFVGDLIDENGNSADDWYSFGREVYHIDNRTFSSLYSNSFTGNNDLIEMSPGSFLSCMTVLNPASVATIDPDYDYPFGLYDFCFTVSQTNNTVAFTVKTPLLPSDVVARKYDATSGTYQNIAGAIITEATLSGDHALKVSYALNDNGPLDIDSAIGAVRDPFGIGVLKSSGSSQGAGAPNTGLEHNTWTFTKFVSLIIIATMSFGVLALIKKYTVR